MIYVALTILAAAVIWQAVQIRQIKKLLKPAVAHVAQARQETIAQWTVEMAKYPVGSPKHTAFKNRLASLGYGG